MRPTRTMSTTTSLRWLMPTWWNQTIPESVRLADSRFLTIVVSPRSVSPWKTGWGNLIEVYRLHVHGQGGEQDVVHLGDGACECMPVVGADLELREVQPSEQSRRLGHGVSSSVPRSRAARSSHSTALS